MGLHWVCQNYLWISSSSRVLGSMSECPHPQVPTSFSDRMMPSRQICQIHIAADLSAPNDVVHLRSGYGRAMPGEESWKKHLKKHFRKPETTCILGLYTVYHLFSASRHDPHDHLPDPQSASWKSLAISTGEGVDASDHSWIYWGPLQWLPLFNMFNPVASWSCGRMTGIHSSL